MKLKYLLPLLTVFAASTASFAAEQLRYAPAVVALTGTILLEDHFGPPNFGESPATDETISAPFLILDTPVDVIADKMSTSQPDTTNTASFHNVRKMHLSLSGDETLDAVRIVANNKQKVLVTGTLYQSHTLHHFTDVLITVKSVEPLN